MGSGTGMKHRPPVRFILRFFEAIAPFAQASGRMSERGRILRKPHAAPVHRLNMHAPEGAQGERPGVRTRAIAIALLPFAPLCRRLPTLLSNGFLMTFSQSFCTFAQRSSGLARWRTQSSNVTGESLHRRQYASASKRPLNQVVTCADQYGLLAFVQERRGAIEDPPQQEGTSYATRMHDPNQVQKPDGYKDTFKRALLIGSS